ncbi:AbrB/MazE/SpoVT family DNA-binding domain-containing protein [Benzoatithermus flavus]|uniref:AbrB/MazE/SpoVT family DNA-binding domain-containing protein n=1 Tax=Benzoatithermus flavus TaxID=3108223 RepID=A0ABU8XPD6_9PROT
MATATMTSKGQLTVPKEIRDQLGLKPGDKVELVPSGDDRVVMRKRRTIELKELFGILPAGTVPLTLEGIDDAIAEEILEKDRRSRE